MNDNNIHTMGDWGDAVADGCRRDSLVLAAIPAMFCLIAFRVIFKTVKRS